jgi:hypothetical protein
MKIKTIKHKGINLNLLTFKRLIGRNNKIKTDLINVVVSDFELKDIYKTLATKLGHEQFLAVNVPKKKVAPKIKKKETVRLFGMDEEIEV